MSCHKLAFNSPEQAARTAAIVQAQNLRDPSTAPRRVYLCPHCDKWHWTRQVASKDGAPSVPFAVDPLPASPKSEPPPPPPPPVKKLAAVAPKVQRRKETPTKQMRVKIERLEGNLSWAKNYLRAPLSRWIRERSDEAALELAVAVDAVIGLPQSGWAQDPEVIALLRGRESDKREWLRATRDPGGGT